MGNPPVDPGGVKYTVIWPAPAMAVVTVGAPGTLGTLTEVDAAEAEDWPAEFVAVTVNV
jgi:hypothetical protein